MKTDSEYILDNDQRQAALDITKSFIVQAPAGSGKTQLLVTRYLRCLEMSQSNPNEVLAITFTNKAAAEMRHRVISILDSVCNKRINDLETRIEKYAYRVLQKDRELSWNIRQNPKCLQILTIDSLANKIINQSDEKQLFENLNISPNINKLYRHAIELFLSDYKDKSWEDQLIIILQHKNILHQKRLQLEKKLTKK